MVSDYNDHLRSRHSSEMRESSGNTHEINTDTNYTYDQDVYQEMKECPMNDQYPDDDYEEIHNIAKKANEFD